MIRYDLGLGRGEHSENDDRSSSLESWDLLVRSVDLPELANHIVVHDTFRHHHAEQLFERGQFGESCVSRQSDNRTSAKRLTRAELD